MLGHGGARRSRSTTGWSAIVVLALVVTAASCTTPPSTTASPTTDPSTAPATTAPATTAPPTTAPPTTEPPPEGGDQEASLASWVDVGPGSGRQPLVVIDDSVYPNADGVQFLINGVVDERCSCRPDGFDATGPQEDSEYHIYPDVILEPGDVTEARWVDRGGADRSASYVVEESGIPDAPSDLDPLPEPANDIDPVPDLPSDGGPLPDAPGIGPLPDPPAVSSSGSASLFVVPGGRGDCSAGSPCGSFEAAVRRAGSGDVVHVAAGEYPRQEIGEVAAARSWSQNVVFEPAPGASVTVYTIDSSSPNLTFRGFMVPGMVYMRPTAHRNRAESNSIGLAFVTGADGTAWIGNRIMPREAGPDAMQIKGVNGDNPNGVVVRGNVIGPAWRKGDSHTDCIQILGGTNIVIEGNKMLPCSDKALQIRSGAGGSVGTVKVVNNFLMECRPRREGCDGWHAITVSADAANRLTLIHNSILGSVAIGPADGPFDGLVQYGNIADELPCTPNTDWNMVKDGSTCGPNDRRGTPTYVDPAQLVGDLHLTSNSAGVGVGSPHAPARDIDGDAPCAAANLGADQFC